MLDQVGDPTGDGRYDFTVVVRNRGDGAFDGHLRIDGTPGGTPVFKDDTQSFPWVNRNGHTLSDLGVVHVGAGGSRTVRFEGRFLDPRRYTLTATGGGERSNTWTLTIRRSSSPTASPTSSS